MKFVFAAALCLFSQAAFSQGIQEIQIEVRTEDGDKRAAIAKATAQASREAALAFLGREKYSKNLRAVQKHIIANHNRYILYSKSGAGRVQDDGKFLTTVTLGFSKKNLQKLLLEHNLFFASKGSLCILPLVSFAFSPPPGKPFLKKPALGAPGPPTPPSEKRGRRQKEEPYYFWREKELSLDRASAPFAGIFGSKGKSASSMPQEAAALETQSAGGEAEALAAGKRLPEQPSSFPPEILAEIFHKQLSLSAVQNGLFSLDPSFGRFQEALSFFGFHSLPFKLPKKGAALNRLTDFLECRLILSGKVRVSQSAHAQESSAPVLTHSISLKAFHARTRRIFFKTSRKILVPAFFSSGGVADKTSSGKAPSKKNPAQKAAEEAADSIQKAFAAVSEKVLSGAVYQLAEEKRDGSLDLHALLLAVQGPLAEFEKERLEKALIKHVPAIKSLQKKSLSAARSVYLAKTDRNVRDLKKLVKSASVPGYSIKIIASGKRRIEIYVKPLQRG